jgi:hypothetical protein
VPSGRRFTLQVRLDRPRRVAFDDLELPRRAGADASGPGWWHDGRFAFVRLPRAAGEVRIER